MLKELNVMKDRIVTKRQKNKKIIGYIREVEPYPVYSCRYIGKMYKLFDASGHIVEESLNYNIVHKKLYEL